MQSELDTKIALQNMEEELNSMREQKTRAQMRKMKVEEALESTLADLRGKKREVEALKRRIASIMQRVPIAFGVGGMAGLHTGHDAPPQLNPRRPEGGIGKQIRHAAPGRRGGRGGNAKGSVQQQQRKQPLGKEERDREIARIRSQIDSIKRRGRKKGRR